MNSTRCLAAIDRKLGRVAIDFADFRLTSAYPRNESVKYTRRRTYDHLTTNPLIEASSSHERPLWVQKSCRPAYLKDFIAHRNFVLAFNNNNVGFMVGCVSVR